MNYQNQLFFNSTQIKLNSISKTTFNEKINNENVNKVLEELGITSTPINIPENLTSGNARKYNNLVKRLEKHNLMLNNMTFNRFSLLYPNSKITKNEFNIFKEFHIFTKK